MEIRDFFLGVFLLLVSFFDCLFMCKYTEVISVEIVVKRARIGEIEGLITVWLLNVTGFMWTVPKLRLKFTELLARSVLNDLSRKQMGLPKDAIYFECPRKEESPTDPYQNS